MDTTDAHACTCAATMHMPLRGRQCTPLLDIARLSITTTLLLWNSSLMSLMIAFRLTLGKHAAALRTSLYSLATLMC